MNHDWVAERRSNRRKSLRRIVLRRVAFMLPTLLGMSILIFGLGRVSLSSPKITALGFFATEQAKAAFDERFHLSEPLTTQYWYWLKGVVVGDFGVSFITRTPVVDALVSGAGVTLWLTAGAFVIAVALGGTIGIIGGLTGSRRISGLISSGTVLAISLPQFWLGLVLIIIFAVNFKLLPAGGYVAPADDPAGFVKFMILPWITLALGPAGLLARVVQVRVAEEARRPHVLTAASLGVSRRLTIGRYIVRNSLAEPINVLGIQVGYMLGGAFLIEQVFGLPGIGATALNAARQGDYPVVQAAAVYTVVAFLLISLIVDLIQAALDVQREESA